MRSLFLGLMAVLIGASLQAQTPSYQMYPQPGHPVKIVKLHPSDKLFPFLSQLNQLKLILMAPGVRENSMYSTAEEKWYTGRCFIIRGKTANFPRRGVLKITAGQFQ